MTHSHLVHISSPPNAALMHTADLPGSGSAANARSTHPANSRWRHTHQPLAAAVLYTREGRTEEGKSKESIIINCKTTMCNGKGKSKGHVAFWVLSLHGVPARSDCCKRQLQINASHRLACVWSQVPCSTWPTTLSACILAVQAAIIPAMSVRSSPRASKAV